MFKIEKYKYINIYYNTIGNKKYKNRGSRILNGRWYNCAQILYMKHHKILKIPKMCCIHHKDDNFKNNKIENL